MTATPQTAARTSLIKMSNKLFYAGNLVPTKRPIVTARSSG
jgi:hypothetical protein